LDALTAGHDVDDELARMKAQLLSGSPAAIEGLTTAQPLRRHRRDGRPHHDRATIALSRRGRSVWASPEIPEPGPCQNVVFGEASPADRIRPDTPALGQQASTFNADAI